MRLARIGDSSWASATFMVVCRAKRPAIWLAWVGSRCWTTTNVKPESAGISLKNSFSESIPPAEAPMPTTRTLETGSSILLHASLAHRAKSRGFSNVLHGLWNLCGLVSAESTENAAEPRKLTWNSLKPPHFCFPRKLVDGREKEV